MDNMNNTWHKTMLYFEMQCFAIICMLNTICVVVKTVDENMKNNFLRTNYLMVMY